MLYPSSGGLTTMLGRGLRREGAASPRAPSGRSGRASRHAILAAGGSSPHSRSKGWREERIEAINIPAQTGDDEENSEVEQESFEEREEERGRTRWSLGRLRDAVTAVVLGVGNG